MLNNINITSIKMAADFIFREKYINFIGIIIIISSIITSLYMNYIERTLYYDEAALAYSLSIRPLSELTKDVFDWDQSAPIIFLYLSKIIIVFFGNTEFNLRIISVISFIIVLIMTYLISKNVFKMKYAVLCSAFVANIPFMLDYSIEFKQYMFESAVTLVAFYIYFLYKEGKISWTIELILFPLIIWCANPVCFIIGGILIYEVVNSIINKNKIIFIYNILIGFVVVCSFLIYYFYWLRTVATGDFMQNYWKSYTFPLIPMYFSDLARAKFLFETQVMDNFLHSKILIEIMSCISIFLLLKNKYFIVFIFGILLALFASYINMFPMGARLWLFIIPFISIIAFYSINIKSSYNKVAEFIFTVIMLILIFINGGIQKYIFKDNIYRNFREINYNIDWLVKNIHDDEYVSVSLAAIPVLKYKIGYNINKIGKIQHENIFYETKSNNVVWDDILKVINSNKCYILSTEPGLDSNFMTSLLENTSRYGFLELIMEKYKTPLYYYVNNIDGLKQRVAYNILNFDIKDNICYIDIIIKNTGQAYIGGCKYDNIVLSSKNRSDIKIYLLNSLAPGDTSILHVEFHWKEGESFIDLQLNNEGKFWFDELGCPPLHIMRPMNELRQTKDPLQSSMQVAL